MSEQIPYPIDLGDAHESLNKIFDDDNTKDKLKSGEWTSSSLHFTVGMMLRNSWGLWQNSPLCIFFKNIGIHHADDMYAIIMDSYIAKLKNEEYDLEKAILHYREYWKDKND